MSGNYDHWGGGVGWGGRRLMEKTILNFHFDYLTTSLRCAKMREDAQRFTLLKCSNERR